MSAGADTGGLTFSFTAQSTLVGAITLTVPAPSSGTSWAKPQTSNSSAPGYLQTNVNGATCGESLGSVTGTAPGPWHIAIDVSCPQNGIVELIYGAGGAVRLAAPTKAGAYAFTARFTPNGTSTWTPIEPCCTVTVNPGSATSLALTLPNVSLPVSSLPPVTQTVQVPSETLAVSAVDQYGNVNTTYSGTASLNWAPGACHPWGKDVTHINIICFFPDNTPTEPSSVSLTAGVGTATVVTPLYYEGCSTSEQGCNPPGYYGNTITGTNQFESFGDAPTTVTATLGGLTGSVQQYVSVGHFNVTGYTPTGHLSVTDPLPPSRRTPSTATPRGSTASTVSLPPSRTTSSSRQTASS